MEEISRDDAYTLARTSAKRIVSGELSEYEGGMILFTWMVWEPSSNAPVARINGEASAVSSSLPSRYTTFIKERPAGELEVNTMFTSPETVAPLEGELMETSGRELRTTATGWEYSQSDEPPSRALTLTVWTPSTRFRL